MTDVLTKLISEISIVCTIGADWVSDKTEFPYACYEYTAGTIEQRRDTAFTVDVWDRNKKADRIESIAAQIRQKLDRQIFRDNEKFVWCYLDTQSSIRDDQERIKRRRLVFQIHDYTIGG